MARRRQVTGQMSFDPLLDPNRPELPVPAAQPLRGGAGSPINRLTRPGWGRGGPLGMPSALPSATGAGGSVQQYVRPHGGAGDSRDWRWNNEDPAEGEVISNEEYRRDFNPHGGAGAPVQPSQPPARQEWTMGGGPGRTGGRGAQFPLNAGPQADRGYASPIGPGRVATVSEPDRMRSNDQMGVINDLQKQWNQARKIKATSDLGGLLSGFNTPGMGAGVWHVGLGGDGIGVGGAMLGTQNMQIGHVDPERAMQNRQDLLGRRTQMDRELRRYHTLRAGEDQHQANRTRQAQQAADQLDKPYFSGPRPEPVPSRATAEAAWKHYDFDPLMGTAKRRKPE